MILIYISGIDGCGKTTQAKRLRDSLKKRGYEAEYKWLRWEPSLETILRPIKQFFLRTKSTGEIDPKAVEIGEHHRWTNFKRMWLSRPTVKWLWLGYATTDYWFTCSRNLKCVHSPLIIADRYIDDFVVDQACNLGIPPEKVTHFENTFLLRKIPDPDWKIIIDIPASEAYMRKNDGTSLSYLEERIPYYKALANSRETIRLDGLEDADSLAGRIEDWVVSRLEGRKS